jgi:hypothetical protein
MTLLLGFAAVNTGNNLLYLLVSALLGFMAVSGVLGRWNLAGLGVRIEVPDEIYDGVPTLLTVRLANRKRLLPASSTNACARWWRTTPQGSGRRLRVPPPAPPGALTSTSASLSETICRRFPRENPPSPEGPP